MGERLIELNQNMPFSSGKRCRIAEVYDIEAEPAALGSGMDFRAKSLQHILRN